MKRIVVDASVVLKWYLADEEYSQKALELLNRYVSDALDLLAPSLLEYEVVNGLMIAKKRGRVEEEDVSNALDGFVSLDIEFKPLSILNQKVLHYCNDYNLSAYDASYLALAEDEEIPFVTADKRLYNSAQKVRWVKWLGDIP